jgi:hypothetical protein
MNSIAWTITMTPSGGAAAFGMPVSGRPAFALVCSVDGAATRERVADASYNAIPKQHQGTQVWSPPT